LAKKEEEKAEKKEEEKHSHKAEKKEEKATDKKAEEKAEHKKAEKKEEKAKHEKEEKKEEKAPEEEKPAKREEHKGHEPREEKKRPHKQKPKRGKHAKKSFVELKPAEITEAIVHLANEGHSQSEIGLILRDQYGIPKVSKALGKKLQAVLEENKLVGQVPEDLMNLIRKSVMLREHLEKNRKDMTAKRGLMLTVSKIRALEKYYKRSGKLPMNWRYSPETAALLAK
jgi:small subunit ribosomal protein S15